MNDTARKFGYPDMVLKEYSHWVVLLRPWQVTLGSLVLVCKDDAKSFGSISEAAAFELKRVTQDCERALKAAFAYEKINYLMLMMVDPDVHFHVIPRYSTVKIYAGQEFRDPFWPKPPDVFFANTVPPLVRDRLLADLKERFG